MALRCLWSLSRASVSCRNVTPVSGIHVGALEMQPTKVPLTEEEKKLLEKLGEPDSETRGYLNELYADFDVAAEKKLEQRQEKKRVKEEKQTQDPVKTLPSSSALNGCTRLSRMFHTSTATSCKDANLAPSLRSIRKPFEDESRIIWDTHEAADYYPGDETASKNDQTEGIVLKRGVTGVFDLEDLVRVLRQEKLKDIAVIQVPAELPYADYLVLGTTFSKRQGRALAMFLKKLYKQTKSKEDNALRIEGDSCDEWKVLDFGNIIVHLFDEPTRKKYDIESLWTVGHEFDEPAEGLSEENDAQDVLAKHMAFVRSLSMQSSSTRS